MHHTAYVMISNVGSMHDFKVAKLTSKNWMKKAEDREGWKNFTKYLGEPAQKKKKGKKKKKRNDN